MKTFVFLAIVVLLAICTGVSYSQVLGIDLSAENIKVAAVRSGNPFHIVVDEQAKRKIPLAIAFEDGQRHFGNNAIGFALRKPFDTYLYAQRLLGQSVSSSRLNELRSSFAYDFVSIPGRGSAVGIQAQDGSIYTPEELIAMSLEHVLKIAYEDGNIGVKDVVMTVPHWFTAIEKESLLNAAELAGMSVMALVTDTGASAVQYGLDRQFDNTNTTQHVAMIDVGASGVEFSYLQYQGVKTRSGVQKIAGHANVITSYSDENIGGHFIDKLLRDYFLDLIDQKLQAKPRKDGITIEDIKKQPRGMAKLLKQAQGIKIVLSANTEAKIHVEGIYKDIDLSGSIKRSTFDQLLQSQLTKLDDAVQRFKATLPIDLDAFDDIVIVGGCARIPIIQQVLKQALKVDKLSQTLNGDEAMVMGAVFMAANQSISFQVRPFLFTDSNNGDVHVHINNEPMTVNTNYHELSALTDEEGNNSHIPGKHVVLFPKHSPINKRKTLTLTRKEDMIVSLNYDSQDVCEGCHAAVKGYTVGGISTIFDEFAKTELTKHEKEVSLGLSRVPKNDTLTEEERTAAHQASLQAPKGIRVSLTFTTAETTVPRLTSAEALVDDWVIVDETAELAKKSKAAAKKAAKKAPKKDDNADDENKEKEETVEESTPPVEETPQQSWRLEKRVKRISLTISQLQYVFDKELTTDQIYLTSTEIHVNGYIPMNSADFKASREKLNDLTKRDQTRRALAEARNNLESLVYQVKTDVEEEPIILVSTEQQREELLSKVQECAQWLDDIGDDYSSNDGSLDWYEAKTKSFQETTKGLFDLLQPVLYRKRQSQDRESTWSSLQQAFDLLKNSTSEFRTSKPWVIEQLDEIDTTASTMFEEMNSLYNQQEQLPTHEDPVWINEEVAKRFTVLTDLLKKASRVAKPKPPKVEKPLDEDKKEDQDEQKDTDAEPQDQQDNTDQQTQQEDNTDQQQQQQENDEEKKSNHDEL